MLLLPASLSCDVATPTIAMTAAPPETYTPLAEAATVSKWKPADTKDVAHTVVDVTAPQEDGPALPIETAARVIHVAASQKLSPRETQAALDVAHVGVGADLSLVIRCPGLRP